MLKIRYYLKFFLFSVTIIISSSAISDTIYNGNFEAEIISYGIRSSESRSSFDPKIGFEVKVTHPEYKIIDANLKKTVVKGIYQKGKYVNGSFIHGNPGINVLDTVKYNPLCSYCKDRPSGRFTISDVENSKIYLKYENNSVKIDDIYNYNIDADLYIKVAVGQEKESVIDGVILNITDKDISEIAKNNIKRFETSLLNDEVSFTLKENGMKGNSPKGSYYGFNVINNKDDYVITKLSIVDGYKEVPIDQRSYGGGSKIFSGGNNDVSYVPQEYINKPLTIKIYYYDADEHLVRLNKDLKKE